MAPRERGPDRASSHGTPALTRGATTPLNGGVMAFVGHVVRAGPWQLPRRFRAVAWMGGVDLDLTEAQLPEEGADVEVFAFMGVIMIHVPRDVRVESLGDAITWSADEGASGGQPETPVRGSVRITGRAVLGKVHVRFVGHGAGLTARLPGADPRAVG